MRRPLAVLTGFAVVAAGVIAATAPAHADYDSGAETVTTTLTGSAPATVFRVATAPKGTVSAVALWNALTVKNEGHGGSYARTRFGGWIDRDRDGENTHAEVLKSESTRTASVNRSGTVKGGKWISAYDNKVFTNASRMDVDHLVPLAEAWASGAWNWTAKKRTAFANDLDFGPSLIAVSLSTNRSKGDRDPAEWMPKSTAYTCTYVKNWIAVKSRWNLSVDTTEKSALLGYLTKCPNQFVDKPARPNVAHLLPKPKPKPVVHKPVAHKPVGGSSSVYYANCAAVRAAGAAPLHAGQPGYETPRLDRDGDGVACE